MILKKKLKDKLGMRLGIKSLLTRLGIISIILLYCGNSFAFQVGLSTNKLAIDDGFKRHSNLGNYSLFYGYSYVHDNIVLSVNTNRLISQSNKETLKKDGQYFQGKSKVTTDTVNLGYRFNRFIPSLFISNAKIEKELMHNENLLLKTNQHSILYGAGVSYLPTKDLSLSSSFLAPNKEQNLKYGINLSVIYNL
jgi:hypothetical protein